MKNAENGDKISPEHIRDDMKSCCDLCQSAFEKLWEEKREHSQHIKQLEQEQAKLKTSLAQLENLDLSTFSCYYVITISCPVHYMQVNIHQLSDRDLVIIMVLRTIVQVRLYIIQSLLYVKLKQNYCIHKGMVLRGKGNRIKILSLQGGKVSFVL